MAEWKLHCYSYFVELDRVSLIIIDKLNESRNLKFDFIENLPHKKSLSLFSEL
jgi:hypothetical protein